MTTDLLDPLEQARQAITAERERSSREKRAFAAFIQRVEALEAATPGAPAQMTDPPQALRMHQESTCAQTEAIWTAYCETVLDMVDFETEYRETPTEHLRAELGDDVAAVINTNEALTQYHKRVITSRVETSIERREEQLETVEEEAAIVDQAERLISDAQAPLDDRYIESVLQMPQAEVKDATTQLDQLTERCDRLLHERQRMLDSRPEAKRFGREATVGYLYRDLDVTYPVIAAVTSLRDRLESQLTDLEAVLDK
jgi:hypothetical protein